MEALLLALMLALPLAGCARVAPWQRESLARPEMSQPPWPLLHKGRQHVYQVREASQGGYGSAGGGCGCN